MDLICKQCGKPLDEHAQFCAFCGTKYELPPVEIERFERAPIPLRGREFSPVPRIPDRNRLAFCVSGFVLGLFSVLFSVLPSVSLFGAVLAIVFSAFGMKKTPSGAGRGFAIAGLILGIAGCLTALFACLIMIIELFNYSFMPYDYDYGDFEFFDSALGFIS